MKHSMIAIVAALVFICSGFAQAQYETGSHEIGFTLGASIPLTETDLTDLGGKKEVAVKTGVNVSGRYLYHTSPKWAFGGELAYATFGDKEHSIPTMVIREGAKAITFEGLAKYTLNPEKKTRPYLIGGIGYGNMQQKTETKPSAGYAWGDTSTTEYRTNYDDNFSAITFSLGLGLESSINDSLTWGVEARWKTIRTDETVVDKLGSGNWELDSSNNITLTAGLNWKFGK